MKKVVLISIDGMRPDAMVQIPFAKELLTKSTYALDASTVFPSVTLPCHISLFFGVEPARHGTTTNTYMPQVRPVTGLIDAAHDAGCSTAMFYSWEELRDIARPGKLDYSVFISLHKFELMGTRLAKCALAYCLEEKPDLVFLYLGEPDEVGHKYGWMTKEYLESISLAMGDAKLVMDALGDEYTVILTADHGGHDRAHGTDMPEDMTIPLFIRGKEAEAGKELEEASILDIAPTVAKLLGVRKPRDWEGKELL